jgi:hypothetical protein
MTEDTCDYQSCPNPAVWVMVIEESGGCLHLCGGHYQEQDAELRDACEVMA